MEYVHEMHDVRWWWWWRRRGRRRRRQRCSSPSILFITIRIIVKIINISVGILLHTAYLSFSLFLTRLPLFTTSGAGICFWCCWGHVGSGFFDSFSLQHKFIRRCVEVYWIANMLKGNGMCMDTSHPTRSPLQMNYCIRPIHTQSAPVHRWILTKSPCSNFTYWMQLDSKREQVWYCILMYFVYCMFIEFHLCFDLIP